MAGSDKTYREVALEDPDGLWELVCGRLRSKPPMTIEHDGATARLAQELILQLDRREYDVRMDRPRLRVSSGSYYLPDVCVVPQALVRRSLETPRRFEVYNEPMPLVVEVWAPSTGDYDVNTKRAEYQRRGDLEIWLLHPYEHWLRAWRRQADGRYAEALFTDNANAYFSEEALKDFASGLSPLGEPQQFVQVNQGLRGGMTLRSYRIRFANGKVLRAWTYEMPSGKLEQYQIAEN